MSLIVNLQGDFPKIRNLYAIAVLILIYVPRLSAEKQEIIHIAGKIELYRLTCLIRILLIQSHIIVSLIDDIMPARCCKENKCT